MTTSTKPKGLDARLHRLTQRELTDISGLQWRSGLTADEPESPATARVLVMLATEKDVGVLDGMSPAQLYGRYYAATVPVTQLQELGEDKRVIFAESGRQVTANLDSSGPETRVDLVHAMGFVGTGVIVGIIDFGLDYTLHDFRDAIGNTRVEFLWDQSLTPQGGEQSPAGFSYGVEYTRADIDAALTPGSFGLVRHVPGVGAHGTHVAGTAAGTGRSSSPGFPAGKHVGMAPNATLIFVQPMTSDDDKTFSDSVHVAEAVAYVFQKARELGLPCVINMSLGQNGGSHDGESVVERAIDAMLAEEGRAMVLAAGNEHVWRGHASGTLQAGQTAVLNWVMGGGHMLGGAVWPTGFDRTPNEMEIWYSSMDEVDITIVDPAGDQVGPVAPNSTEALALASGASVFVDHERFTRLNGDALVYIEVSPPPGGTLAPGAWQVRITPTAVRHGRFDAWIERDARDRANNFADQSFFGGDSFDGHMTLGTPATTRRGIAVANYDHRTTSVAASSSRGGTRDGRAKPEVAAPGTNIVASNSGGGPGGPPVRVSMSGTSMAAPHVAGVVALMLQKNDSLTAAQIRGVLQASSRPVPGQVLPFDEAWGFGRLDAKAAIDLTP